jgi:hypothetical protein
MNSAEEIGRGDNDRYWGVEGGTQLRNCAWVPYGLVLKIRTEAKAVMSWWGAL